MFFNIYFSKETSVVPVLWFKFLSQSIHSLSWKAKKYSQHFWTNQKHNKVRNIKFKAQTFPIRLSYRLPVRIIQKKKSSFLPKSGSKSHLYQTNTTYSTNSQQKTPQQQDPREKSIWNQEPRSKKGFFFFFSNTFWICSVVMLAGGIEPMGPTGCAGCCCILLSLSPLCVLCISSGLKRIMGIKMAAEE